MSTATTTSITIALPERPDLRHLKDQARDLVKAGDAETLSKAQFKIAKQYGFASWTKLKKFVESLTLAGQLKDAIDANDLARVKNLMTEHPELHSAPLGYNKNGPLTWVAECRVPRVAPSETRLAMAAWMIENGSDVHEGGDGPLMRAALDDSRIPMMEMLVSYGADVNALWNGSYPIILAPCETLAPASLRWLLAHGADPNTHSNEYGSPLAMLVGTYSRNSEGKHGCLETLAAAGFDIPDTPTLAIHRGRTDLLEANLLRDPDLLSRHYRYAEVFLPEVGLKSGDGLTFTPLDGVTLLHIAVEFEDTQMARWLLEQGADANARSTIDSDGFGGHGPLHHTVISVGDRSADRARLLLDHGADPNIRATFRKQLGDMGEPEKEKMFEYRNATPIGYARQYQEPAWVNEAAIAEIVGRGGTE